MRVNRVFTGFFANRLMVGICIATSIIIFFIASSFKEHSDLDLSAKEVNIIIRQIGHRLLQQSGDSTSRVLPVAKIKEGVFVLRFENEFVFNHDSLMAMSQRLLPKAQFPSGYIVTVHDCRNGDIVYGFQLNNTSSDLLPCKGRSELPGCYTVEFAFPDFYPAVKKKEASIGQPTTTSDSEYPVSNVVFIGAAILLSAGFLVWRFRKKPVLVQDQNRDTITQPASELPALGKFLLNVKGHCLLLGKEVITLTDKECRVLELLYKNFGELIPRETLMQEVWINEGVITGRSLDMFVSKLRKKLSPDPDLRITNVHGRGYKLEIPEKNTA